MSDGENNDEAPIKRALWLSLAVLVLVGIAAAGLFLYSDQPIQAPEVVELETQGPVTSQQTPVSMPDFQFTDITDASGIHFIHENGAYGERLLPETMGGGVAFLDYDNDDHLDLLLINSNHWSWHSEGQDRPTMHLYKGRGDGTFTAVTHAAGLDLSLYGMGVAVGDFDGDNRTDLFITAVGENRLLRNTDGNRFTDVTQEMRVAGTGDAWSTGAAFFDYDRDGDLDLFVCNYVVWSREINSAVDYRLTGIGRAYGPPNDFAGTQSLLYRNDGTHFTDVSQSAGIHVVNEATGAPTGKGLAVHPLDVNRDGWLDLVVANDTVRNFLFLNMQNGQFKEVGIEYGLAFDTGGMATGAMGIDAAYFANDDRLAVAIGNFANEMSSFYVSRHNEQVFSDDAIVAGIGADSRRVLTFGLIFVDLDLDGRLDLLAASGHVEPEINKVQSSQQYAQPIQIYWNCGDACSRQYRLVSQPMGDISRPLVGRGAAYGDIDHDGDPDLVFTAVGGKVTLLRNDQKTGHHWITLKLRGELPNADAIGASVVLDADSRKQYQAVMPARSYLSQMALPLTMGLGNADSADRVTVTWPDGLQESWTDLKADQVYRLNKGEGRVNPG